MENNTFFNKLQKLNNINALTNYFLSYMNDILKDDLNFAVYINNKIEKSHSIFSLYPDKNINKLINKKKLIVKTFLKKEKVHKKILLNLKTNNTFFNTALFVLTSDNKPDVNNSKTNILFNYFILQLLSIFKTNHEILKTKLREKGIIAIREFAELLNYLEFKDKNAFQSMFLGFTAESIGANRVTLYFYQEKTKQLFPSIIMVYKNKKLYPYDFYSELMDTVIETKEDVCGMALSTQEPIHLESVENTYYKGIVDQKIGMKINSIISIPIIIRDHIFGVIEVANEKKNKSLDEFDYYIISIISKLATSKIEHSQLYDWAIKDNLTQLYNFHFLQSILDKEIIRIKRHPNNLCVIIMDIDDFKIINDTYGHPAGNIVLRTISHIIKINVRKTIDIPIRYGGDEFLLILPETDIKGAQNLSKRILNSVKSYEFQLDNTQVKVTCSIGISTIKHGQNIDKETLIKKADNALYESKNNGKNRITTSG